VTVEQVAQEPGTILLPPEPVVTRRTWLALGVLMLGVTIAMLDTTIVNVALPTIRTSLNASEATLAWIVSGYALAFGLALVPAGRIGDRIGHAKLFILGIAGFTLTSLWCGLSNGAMPLIVGRILQGAFGGIFFPAVLALLQLMFPLSVRGRAFSIQGAVVGFATALGPIVGGLLIAAFGDTHGWRSIFFVNLPIGLIAAIAAIKLLPRDLGGSVHARTDIVGLLLLTAALSALLVPLIQGQDAGWPRWTIISIVAGVLGLVVFALFEIYYVGRGGNPLVPPRLFIHPQFRFGVLLAMVYFAGFSSIPFTLSILWQSGLGHDALSSGLVLVPFAIGSIIGSTLSNRLARQLGRTVLAIGTGLVALGLAVVWFIIYRTPGLNLTHWMLAIPLLIAGTGSGLFIPPNQQFIISTVDPLEAGAASGVLGTCQRVGTAIGIAVIGSVLFSYVHAAADPVGLAESYRNAAAHSMLLNVGLVALAFALVFTLPKRVGPAARADD